MNNRLISMISAFTLSAGLVDTLGFKIPKTAQDSKVNYRNHSCTKGKRHRSQRQRANRRKAKK